MAGARSLKALHNTIDGKQADLGVSAKFWVLSLIMHVHMDRVPEICLVVWKLSEKAPQVHSLEGMRHVNLWPSQSVWGWDFRFQHGRRLPPCFFAHRLWYNLYSNAYCDWGMWAYSNVLEWSLLWCSIPFTLIVVTDIDWQRPGNRTGWLAGLVEEIPQPDWLWAVLTMLSATLDAWLTLHTKHNLVWLKAHD